jgi:DNA polymerase-4
MATHRALQLCPHAILVPPRFEVYREASYQIREIFREYTDLIEPLSLDEAYLDVTVNKKNIPSATIIAREIKKKIFHKTRLTASAGVSVNKFLAKIASDMNKPDGLTVIRPGEVERFIEKLAIGKFHGIGKVTEEKMKSLGIYTGKDLKAWNKYELMKRFGKVGSFYYHIVRGEDNRAVNPHRIRKSIGKEKTFKKDLESREEMESFLEILAEKIEGLLKRYGVKGKTLTLKVRYEDFQTITRSRTGGILLETAADLLKIANELLAGTEVQFRKVRLLGLSVSNLTSNEFEEDDSPYIGTLF